MALRKSSVVDVLENMLTDNVNNVTDSYCSWIFFETTKLSWFPVLSLKLYSQVHIPIYKEVAHCIHLIQ